MKHLTLSNQSQFSYQKAANFFACVYWINCQNKNYPVLIVMAKVLSTFFLMQHALKKTRNIPYATLHWPRIALEIYSLNCQLRMQLLSPSLFFLLGIFVLSRIY